MILVLLTLFLLIAQPTHAATFFVSTGGSDTSAGTSSGTAWRTIQKAANTVSPGDTVNVAAGTYQERVTFPTGGTAGSVVTFLCQTNRACVVDGGTLVNTGWTASAGFVTGVFERANTAYGFGSALPAHATLNDKEFVFVRPGITPSIDYIQLGVGSQEWDGIQAACRNYGTITRCHFQDNANPNTKNMKLAPEGIGAFHVNGSTKGYLTFDGFFFKNAYSCLVIENFAHHITLQNSTCTNGYYATQILTGAHDNLLQFNTWNLNWIYADTGNPRYATVNAVDPIQENLFQAMRSNMPIMSSVYIVDAGNNNRVLRNTFDHTGAAGVYQWSTQYHVDPGYTNFGTEIGYNTFSHCQDYCTQIQDTDGGNFQFHDNKVSNYYNGFRIGRVLSPAGQNFYVYRNTFTNPTGCDNCGRGGDLEFSAVNSVAAGIFPNGAKAYIYHNTFNSRDSSILAYSQQNLSNMFFINNIHSAAKSWVFELANNPSFMGRSWVGGSGGATAPSFSTQMRWNVPNRIWTNAETAFALPAGHSAIDAGIDLSQSWSAGTAGTQPALPGMTVGGFAGTAPDLGAVEFGTVAPSGGGQKRLSGTARLGGITRMQ